MKDSFSSFVLRDLIALLSGLMLMLLHGTVEQGILTALVPQSAAPWELSKLVFWPLVICAAAGRVRPCTYPNFPGSAVFGAGPAGDDHTVSGCSGAWIWGAALRSHLDGGTGGGTGIRSGWPTAFICLDGLGSGTGRGICAPGPSAVFVAAVPAAGAGCIRFVSGGLTVYFLT